MVGGGIEAERFIIHLFVFVFYYGREKEMFFFFSNVKDLVPYVTV